MPCIQDSEPSPSLRRTELSTSPNEEGLACEVVGKTYLRDDERMTILTIVEMAAVRCAD